MSGNITAPPDPNSDPRVINMLIEFGYTPFILIGYKDRQEVELRYERDSMDERLIASLLDGYTTDQLEFEPDDEYEW